MSDKVSCLSFSRTVIKIDRRFLIAVKGNVEATQTRLTKHLVWRRTFNCYNVAEVAETIKGEVRPRPELNPISDTDSTYR
jgi:hypothetical protein